MADLNNLGIVAPHMRKYYNRYTIDWLAAEVRDGTPLHYATFWLAGRGEENCMLSQWYQGRPILVNGRVFATAEQYMMAGKALLFHDLDSYQRIMATPDPRQCKALGRQVANFDQAVWDAALREILFTGNLLKLQSDLEVVDALLSTGNAVLIEASPYDDIYGAGLDKAALLASDGGLRVPPWEWRKPGSARQAENHLGFVLMGLRDLICQMIGYRFAPGMAEEKLLWEYHQ